MSKEDIARIDATMKSLVVLTREQNTTLKKVLETLTKTRATQEFHTDRLSKLESDKSWLIRLILSSLIIATMVAIKAI
ncbi:hypothetical protein [Aliivibrio logei]|jgi:type IV secretory pathway component VirB8|uniref:hypothetical protein n=1 Tax=Aliivibrio logei TaxID=688 RepID=UPI0003A8F2AD|nr:hypothetical protein [Aliivibrio logei]